MKLGGKFLGFNVDAKFSNVLDGLLLVDLREARPDLLARYLGKQGSVEFLARHGVTVSAREASVTAAK
jgi:hypothetical protein